MRPLPCAEALQATRSSDPRTSESSGKTCPVSFWHCSPQKAPRRTSEIRSRATRPRSSAPARILQITSLQTSISPGTAAPRRDGGDRRFAQVPKRGSEFAAAQRHALDLGWGKRPSECRLGVRPVLTSVWHGAPIARKQLRAPSPSARRCSCPPPSNIAPECAGQPPPRRGRRSGPVLWPPPPAPRCCRPPQGKEALTDVGWGAGHARCPMARAEPSA